MLARYRPLLAPGLATLTVLAILIALGLWQLERKAWKESLIARIDTRARAAPAEIVPEARWPDWRAADDEFRRVRLSGTFLHDRDVAVHGLMSSQRGSPVQGYYLFTPLRLAERRLRPRQPRLRADGAARSGAPERDRADRRGRAHRPRARARDARPVHARERARCRPLVHPRPRAMAARTGSSARRRSGSTSIPPERDGWPRPGQTRFAIPNNHLGYAVTWFGLALTLVAVFGAWARRRAQGLDAVPR